MSLERFHQAQESDFAGYATALAEIKQGQKRSHWIWYIFPQLEGLGHSAAARAFALRDLAEAQEYLKDPALRQRYEEITAAVQTQLSAGRKVDELMGSNLDALKLVSSLTLFRAAAHSLAGKYPALATLAEQCDFILQRTAAQGYPPCAHTRLLY